MLHVRYKIKKSRAFWPRFSTHCRRNEYNPITSLWHISLSRFTLVWPSFAFFRLLFFICTKLTMTCMFSFFYSINIYIGILAFFSTEEQKIFNVYLIFLDINDVFFFLFLHYSLGVVVSLLFDTPTVLSMKVWQVTCTLLMYALEWRRKKILFSCFVGICMDNLCWALEINLLHSTTYTYEKTYILFKRNCYF